MVWRCRIVFTQNGGAACAPHCTCLRVPMLPLEYTWRELECSVQFTGCKQTPTLKTDRDNVSRTVASYSRMKSAWGWANGGQPILVCYIRMYVIILGGYSRWRPNGGLTMMPMMPWHGAPRWRGPPEQLSDFFGMGPISLLIVLLDIDMMVDYLAFFDDQHGNSTMGPP